MEDVLILDIDEAVIERLEARAAKAGKSLEQIICEILTDSVKSSPEEELQK